MSSGLFSQKDIWKQSDEKSSIISFINLLKPFWTFTEDTDYGMWSCLNSSDTMANDGADFFDSLYIFSGIAFFNITSGTKKLNAILLSLQIFGFLFEQLFI